MGSTTRRCGVHGGEYAPIGLRLFSWWRKNGERRLQKLGSGSVGIRSNLIPLVLLSFYKRCYLQNNFCYLPIGQVWLLRAVHDGQNHLVHVIAEIDRIDRERCGLGTPCGRSSGQGP
jgi:hypothetical protein